MRISCHFAFVSFSYTLIVNSLFRKKKWKREINTTLSSIASLFKIASIMRLIITATYIHFVRKLSPSTYWLQKWQLRPNQTQISQITCILI